MKKIRKIKGDHMMKSATRARSKIKKLDDMTDALESKGIEVNKDSLAQRVKNPRRIADLEEAQDKKAKRELGLESDSDDDSDSVMSDDDLKKKEGEERGRSRKAREHKQKKSTLLGKRRAEHDHEMVSDDDQIPVEVRGSMGKSKRNMTVSQRKISAKKVIRERTASRREGNEPQRLEFKPVPEEHVRLAKKINSMWKHKIQRTEADREVNVKRPKHLYSGKQGRGKKDWR